MTTRRQALRTLVAKRQGLVVPGAYDGISARLVQHAGFPAVYMYMPFGDFNELIGVNAQLALAERYRDDDRSAT